jgi:hypothetical protein
LAKVLRLTLGEEKDSLIASITRYSEMRLQSMRSKLNALNIMEAERRKIAAQIGSMSDGIF